MNNDHCYYGTDPKEYEAFGMVTPHHDAFQVCIANVLCAGLRDIHQPRIVEIGCGTGITTKKVHTAIPGARIVAIDNDPAILEVAKSSLPGTEVSYVCENASDCLNMMEPHSVDAVYSAYCIHNLQPQAREHLFTCIAFVLKVGGVFVNGDKIARNDIVQHWQDLRSAIDSFQAFRGTPYRHLEAMWIKHYLEDEAISLREEEHAILILRKARCSDITMHARWGTDAVVSATRSKR